MRKLKGENFANENTLTGTKSNTVDCIYPWAHMLKICFHVMSNVCQCSWCQTMKFSRPNVEFPWQSRCSRDLLSFLSAQSRNLREISENPFTDMKRRKSIEEKWYINICRWIVKQQLCVMENDLARIHEEHKFWNCPLTYNFFFSCLLTKYSFRVEKHHIWAEKIQIWTPET